MNANAIANTQPTLAARFTDIAHVLFMDIVGYTRQSTETQVRLVREMQAVVKDTPTFQRCDQDGTLVKLPRGDGMALVFLGSPLDPVRCAIEISEQLRCHRSLRIRMGIHSGLVCLEPDLNGCWDALGEGINGAHRAMEPGDADHILITAVIWRYLLNERLSLPIPEYLGLFRAKHGTLMELYNLHASRYGNASTPKTLRGRYSSRQADVQPSAIARAVRVSANWAAACGVALTMVFAPLVTGSTR